MVVYFYLEPGPKMVRTKKAGAAGRKAKAAKKAKAAGEEPAPYVSHRQKMKEAQRRRQEIERERINRGAIEAAEKEASAAVAIKATAAMGGGADAADNKKIEISDDSDSDDSDDSGDVKVISAPTAAAAISVKPAAAAAAGGGDTKSKSPPKPTPLTLPTTNTGAAPPPAPAPAAPNKPVLDFSHHAKPPRFPAPHPTAPSGGGVAGGPNASSASAPGGYQPPGDHDAMKRFLSLTIQNHETAKATPSHLRPKPLPLHVSVLGTFGWKETDDPDQNVLTAPAMSDQLLKHVAQRLSIPGKPPVLEHPLPRQVDLYHTMEKAKPQRELSRPPVRVCPRFSFCFF